MNQQMAVEDNTPQHMVSPQGNFQSTKSYEGYPCAHRQHLHDGVCALVHGYSRSFEFIFGCHTRDRCGFVVDFGELKWVKELLDKMFDHTLLLNMDDPLMGLFHQLEAAGAADLRIMPYGVGMEGTAQYLCETVDARLRQLTNGRCWVNTVEARENPKNSAIYLNPKAGFRGWL